MTTAATARPGRPNHGPGRLALRAFAGAVVALLLLFLADNYLIVWRDWPGLLVFVSDREWFGFGPLREPLEGNRITLGWIQLGGYVTALGAVIGYVLLTRERTLRAESGRLSAFAAYIVGGAFWSVFLVGLADMLISFLRVEGLLEAWVGAALTADLGRAVFRGTYIHYPLVVLAFVVALFVRSLGFAWLALLVVLAEFQIVISRFVFSYEQAFMGDLVRFWYAALFLFASAYTLIEEGHVRVDVLYTHFSARRKAWVNLLGSLFLGMPLCWTIVVQGMWSAGASLNSPLHSFEISQSGYGMYVKYLMAGFLVVYAVSMLVQFAASFLDSAADLHGEPRERESHAEPLG